MDEEKALRLGHITYSNCFPVHAGILDGGLGAGLRVVEGVPSHLNELLGRGEIDVAPIPLRISAALARLATRVVAAVGSRLGADEVADQAAAAQRSKR